MISIITSSYKPDDFRRFSKSVEQTVGTPFEIIQIENPGIMGICEAYNKGGRKAKYPFLCFVHEDVEFKNFGWGKQLIDLFEQEQNIALAGVAGSRYKPEFVTGWATLLPEFDRVNITHPDGDGKNYLWVVNPDKEKHSEVKTLDGVFLFTRKANWEKHPFDETIKGFHFYDLAFSLLMQNAGKSVVSYAVDLTHYSGGTFDDRWAEAAFDFHSRYINLIRDQGSFSEVSETDKTSIKWFWWNTLSRNLSLKNRLRILANFNHWRELLLSMRSSALMRIRPKQPS